MKPIFRMLVLLVFMLPAYANEFDKALDGMCENIKRCSLAKLRVSSPDIAKMQPVMEALLEKGCLMTQAKFKTKIEESPNQYHVVLSCVQSIENAKCEVFEDSGDITEECKAFEGVAEK